MAVEKNREEKMKEREMEVKVMGKEGKEVGEHEDGRELKEE